VKGGAVKVVFKAGFDVFSRYGSDGISMAVALERAGHDVTLLPTAVLPGLPRKFTQLLEKNPAGAKDVCLWFGPADQIRPDEHEGLPLVAWTCDGWGADESWAKAERVAVAAPSTVESFAEDVGGPQVDLVPTGIDPDEWEVVDRRGADRPMTFLADVGSEKAVTQAFAELRAEYPTFDAEMVLLSAAMSREMTLAAYAGSDVFVSVGHGDGFGTAAMRAMSTGLPLIGGRFLANENLLYAEAAWEVGGSIVCADGKVSGPCQFNVSTDGLKAEIRRLRKHPAEAQAKGAQAARIVRASMMWEHVAARMTRTLVEAVS
jgi:hypothetical protein